MVVKKDCRSNIFIVSNLVLFAKINKKREGKDENVGILLGNNWGYNWAI